MISTLSKKHSFNAVYDSQKVYRLILDAMSNPAKVVMINGYADKLYGRYPAFIAVAITLLDNEVSFHVCGNDSLTDEIASIALARREKNANADFVFVCDLDYMEHAIENAKCGTLADPHKSATIIIQTDGAPSCGLTLYGPGIDGKTVITVSKAVKDAIAVRDAQHYEYPQGIDLLFISDTGELLAIPRFVRVVG